MIEVGKERIDITVTLSILMERNPCLHQTSLNVELVILAFKEVLIDALQKRIKNCTDGLIQNKGKILACSEYSIIFQEGNGKIHKFNILAYSAMKSAINYLEAGQLKPFITNSLACSQCIKALYWVDVPADCNGYSFENLITILSELS